MAWTSCSKWVFFRFDSDLSVLQFLRVLQRELDAVEKDKDSFIKEFSEVSILTIWCFLSSSMLDVKLPNNIFLVYIFSARLQ